MSTPWGYHHRHQRGLRGWLARRWLDYRIARVKRARQRRR